MTPEVEVNLEMVPMFKGQRTQNVVFLLDTSENMKGVLDSAKHLLIQALLARSSYRESLFNIMAFSNKLNRWSQNMLPCAPHTVYEALSWVHSLTCGPGGELLEETWKRPPGGELLAALCAALMDPDCSAVHVVTSGPPHHMEALLHAMLTVADGRMVNVFYLLDHSSPRFNRLAQDSLRCPALATRGSCYLIPVGSNGVLMGKAIPFHMTESHKSVSTPCPVKSVSPSIHTPNQHVSHPLYRCRRGNHLITSCLPCDLTQYSSSSSMGYFPGCRVLARRQQDGIYYLGTLVQECRIGLWLVELDHLESSSTVSMQQLQLVCSLDMIQHTEAHAKRLVPGDAVLSPWEPGVRRYGPGVVTVMEHEDSLSDPTFLHGVADGGTSLWVRMWSGCVALVPRSLVVPIPSSDYSRLVRELQQGVMASTHSWPCTTAPPCAYLRGCQSTPATCYCHPISCPRLSTCARDRGSGDEYKRAELEKEASLMFENLAATEMARSKSSLAMAEGVTIVVSPPRVRPKGDQSRPPWRYWKRSTPEPQHRKPGMPVPRGASQPARLSFPVLQVKQSPNHNSVFKTIAVSVGRADIRDVFEGTHFKPRPPALSKTNAATSVHLRMN